MRIRKNAKIYSSLLPPDSKPSAQDRFLEPHICQINRSPWDVILLSPTSDFPLLLPSLDLKLEQEGSSSGTRSSSNCPAPPFDSFPVEAQDDKKSNLVKDAVDGMEYHGDVKRKIKSKKKKNEEKRGKQATSNCAHQLVKCSSTNSDNAIDKKRPARRGKATSKSGSANPYEFYYYSGFGPSWSKRRRLGSAANDGGQYRNFRGGGESDSTVSCRGDTTPLSIMFSAFGKSGDPTAAGVEEGSEQYILEEEDDADEEDEKEGRRRIRKMVKARSLKSLCKIG